MWLTTGGYVDGSFHGTWVFWEGWPMFDPPVACAVATYDRGTRSGPTTAWREDGSLDPEVTGWYEDDVRVRDLEAHEVHRRPGG
jgi:hypothetical protein